MEPGLRFEKWVKPSKGGCLLWQGCLTHGYGRFWTGERLIYAHYWLWEQDIGPIPKGHELHHTCDNRHCVNVRHLELLPMGVHRRKHREELRRKAFCPKGHPLKGDNLYVTPAGYHQCRLCHAQRERRRRKICSTPR